MFAGIGGFHLALKSQGMECVFTSEINDYSRKTYAANFKEKYLEDSNLFNDDIWHADFKKIPDFDILCGGFPCQPFSQAGHKKGFKDNKDGNLFVKDAFKSGASLAVVSRFKNGPKQIKVKNTLEFLTKTSLKIRENTLGKIIAITHGESLSYDISIDATGKIVTPGFIDLHTHSMS